MIRKKKIERVSLSAVRENINNNDYMPIGVIGRHHGKSGEVKVFSYIQDLNLFERYLKNVVRIFDKITKEVKYLEVESERYAKDNCFYLKFKEINSLSEAESILNYEIYLKNEQLPELEDGYYFFEIIGSEVFLSNEKIGKVVDVIQTGSNDVFEVLKTNGEKILIPSIADYIKSIDKKNKRIELVKSSWK